MNVSVEENFGAVHDDDESKDRSSRKRARNGENRKKCTLVPKKQ